MTNMSGTESSGNFPQTQAVTKIVAAIYFEKEELIMKQLKEKVCNAIFNAKLRLESATRYIQKRAGLSDTIEKLLWVLGAIAIVGLIIATITVALTTDILPSIITKIKAGF